MQIESVSYCWSENDPLSVDFLRSAESQILTVEQKVSRKGEISAEVCTYEINSGKMQRATMTSIAIGTQICCHSFSPDQEKLFLGSIDRKISLHDLVQQVTKVTTRIDIVSIKFLHTYVIICNSVSYYQIIHSIYTDTHTMCMALG